MIRIRQKFNQTRIQDVYGAVLEQFKRREIRNLVHAKDRVAVGCGSRGIHGMDVIAKGVIDSLLELGARPFASASIDRIFLSPLTSVSASALFVPCTAS